jgi:primary-amine oxidase
MAFLVDAQDSAAGTPEPAPHPLAPLSAAEIEAASSALKSAKGLGDTARFVYVSLYEPAKHEVIAFEEGGPAPDRLAKVIIREHAERATYEAVVSIPDGAVTEFSQVPGVQTSIMVEEFLIAEDLVRKDPRWQEAMLKRGITDFDLCMIDPWPTDLGAQRPGRPRLRPPGRGRGHPGRPGHADGGQRGGPRRPAGPEGGRQLLRGADHRPR